MTVNTPTSEIAPVPTVQIKAYVDAKHRMTTSEIELAIEVEIRRRQVAEDEVTYHSLVLAGYQQALNERQ